VLKRQHPELSNEKQVQAMTRAIQSGVRLTRQLLSFTRKQALKPETVDFQTWLPATEGLIRSTLGASITWQAQVEPDTRPVNVDIGELELALINLVVNARHAMPSGGSLGVHAANADESLAFERPMVGIAVTDTGVGIPPDLLTKVFEPFFTTRSKGTGSGLGLSQVQGFCAQAGGSARIESVVGHGTTVSMYLPAVAPVKAPEPSEQAQAIHLEGRVLLVEDNEDLATTTELMLRAAGLDVVRKSNAATALAYIDSLPTLPDVVLSDIAMPGSMDGIGLAFALRTRHPKLPVVLTTGYTDQLHQAVAGGLRVLPKPVAPEELLNALSAVIAPARGAPVRH
jgi:two-component system NtrC family sensor kinase